MNSTNSTLLWKIIFFWCCWAITSVYLLSFGNHLTSVGVRISFLLFVIAGLIWQHRTKSKISAPGRWSAVAIGIVGILFFQGVMSAPTTTDAMVYHLPRVIGWIQQRTVFQTTIFTSHDYMAPFAEILVTYLYLLTGNDRLSFFPQLLAWIGLLGVSFDGIRRLTPQTFPHLKMALVAVMLPIALLEAVSTQTDLVMAFFLCVSLEFALRFRLTMRWKSIFLCSIAAAAAIMTKQVAVVFLIPTAMLVVLHSNQWKKRVGMSLVAGCCVVPIVGMGLVSNVQLYGTLLGQRADDPQAISFFNEIFTPGVILQNVVRNTLIQLPFPVIGSAIDRLGGVNDSRTTWPGSVFHVPTIPIPQEDIAPNPLHVVIIVVGGVLILKKGSRTERLIMASGVASYVLFSLLFKWQPYNNRLTLSVCLLMIPFALSAVWREHPRWASILGTCMVIIGVVVIMANTSKPLISYQPFAQYLSSYVPSEFVLPESLFTQQRFSAYYLSRPYWEEPYQRIANDVALSGYTVVGIDAIDGYRYPLMVELRRVIPRVHILGEGQDGEVTIVTMSRSRDEDVPPHCRVSTDRLHQACLIFLR